MSPRKLANSTAGSCPGLCLVHGEGLRTLREYSLSNRKPPPDSAKKSFNREQSSEVPAHSLLSSLLSSALT